jgi:indolepyruvate ferredoxin oxidoreductase alpha subunit
MNAAWNGADIVVCLLDNSTTAMTGGQPHPGMGLRLNGAPAKKISLPDIAAAAGADSVRRVNAFDLDSCKRAATEAAAEKGVRVIIFEGACINIVPKGKPLSVSEDSCTGCNVCVSKLGCPALSMGKLATIDPVLCTGCGLCAKVCPFDAIGNAAGGVTSVAKGGAKNE